MTQEVAYLTLEGGEAVARIAVIPTHVTIPQAAKLTGHSQDFIRELANNRLEPIPYIQAGNRKKLNTAALLERVRSLEIGQ